MRADRSSIERDAHGLGLAGAEGADALRRRSFAFITARVGSGR
jgi:hypothetical protein